ncbi:hypothetical protein V8F33_006728 [Rhypophila sp. PSN 637]
MAKTSAVFLGSVAVATVCAHKFWPKGFIYGEKEEWEKEEAAYKKKKKAIKDELEKAADGRAGGLLTSGNGTGNSNSNGGRSRSQSQSQSTTSGDRDREFAYRDRASDRLAYNADSSRTGNRSGGGEKGVVVRSEQDTLVYRDDRDAGGADGRKSTLVIQQAAEEDIVYHGRIENQRNRSRSQHAPRLFLPADDGVVYKRSTTARVVRDSKERDYDDYGPSFPRTNGTSGHMRSRSAHNTNPPIQRAPSPTTTTMAVAGSPVTATDGRRQQLQAQQKRDQDRNGYYLLPAPTSTSSQRQGPSLGRSNSFSTTPAPSVYRRERRSPSPEPIKITTQRITTGSNGSNGTKYYYQDEEPLPRLASSRRTDRDRSRERERERKTVYVYRDRDQDRDRRDVKVVDTYYDYNYR